MSFDAFKSSVEPTVFKYLTELPNISATQKLSLLATAADYKKNPQLHQMTSLFFEYDSKAYMFKSKLNLLGTHRYAYIGNPLFSNRILQVEEVEFYTNYKLTNPMLARYEDVMHQLPIELREKLKKALDSLKNESLIRNHINHAALFHRVLPEQGNRVKLKL